MWLIPWSGRRDDARWDEIGRCREEREEKIKDFCSDDCSSIRSFRRMVWPIGANRTRSRNIDRVARVSPLVRSGISPRQKCTRRVSRDRLLLGIPDRRPDVIGQGNLAEKGKPRRTSTLMRRYRFRSPNTMAKEPPAFPLSLVARGILLCTIHSQRLFDVHSTGRKGRGGGKNNYRQKNGVSKKRVPYDSKLI